MIIYFSATGNSYHIAHRIAIAIGDIPISIEDVYNGMSLSLPKDNSDQFIVVSPTYIGGLPNIVEAFFKILENDSEETNNFAHVYKAFVATYGSSPGQIRQQTEKLFHFDAYFSVRMPDIWSSTFDSSDQRKAEHICAEANVELADVIESIRAEEYGNFMLREKFVLTAFLHNTIYEKIRNTSHLRADDNCNGCGLCEARCPDKAIEISNGKAAWVKNKCSMCLRCVYQCPQVSILYDNTQKSHGQYFCP